MKRIDIFCSSQASTAIYSSTMLHHHSSASSFSSAAQLGGRAIDRHNPIIKDGRRITTTTTVPCASPINPKPYHLLHNKKSSSNNNKSVKQSEEKSNKNKKKKKNSDECKENSVIRKSGLIAPPADSSRYLLSDSSFVDGLLSPEYDFIKPTTAQPLLIGENEEELLDSKIVSNSNLKASSSESVPPVKLLSSNRLERPCTGQVNFCSSRLERPSSSSSSDQQPQVVVLRVSLHCKGCEGKVRKHLSKMEGVKSYNIDYAAKKVTIVGDVTPSSVLASVSKVKSAQFWPEDSKLAPPSNQVIKRRYE